MKTAIVTGATGFIGNALTHYLLECGYRVIAVARNPSKLKLLPCANLNCVQADFENYTLLSDLIDSADIFYHFAWQGVYGSDAADFTMQLRNVQATCEAFSQALRIGCTKFVFAGSISELEVVEHIDKNVCTPREACIYATAKLTAEQMCKTLAFKHGIEFNSGLLANIIGPGDFSFRSTNSILTKFLHGESPKLVKGEGLNDWLYIKDAVRLIVAMGEQGKSMKTYYIGHTHLWTLKEIVEKARDVVAPNLQLTFGEMPDSFLTNYNYISTTDLMIDTGLYANYNFEQAIRETAQWLLSLKR